MTVVAADVRADAVDDATAELRADGLDSDRTPQSST